MTALSCMSQNTGADKPATSELVIITRIAKTGNRFVLGVPAQFQDRIKPYHGQIMRVKIEPLL